MKQLLSISDSFENTSYDVRSKTRTFKKYGVEPFICVPQYTSADGSSLKNDISESLIFCFESGVVDAIAIGLVRDPEDVSLIASVLAQVEHKIVIAEPGLIDDSGNIMVSAETYEEFRTNLLPQVQFISINLLETEVLSGMECKTMNDCLMAVKSIFDQYNCLVYLRGGRVTEEEDLLFAGSMVKWFKPQRLPFSYSPDRSFLAAVACELVTGKAIIEAVASARRFYAGESEAAAKPASEPKLKVVTEPVVEETTEEPATAPSQPAIGSMPDLKKEPTLISPAKSLRDIAHSISYDDKGTVASKSTVSDLSANKPAEEKPRSASSELDAMRAKLKKIAEM